MFEIWFWDLCWITGLERLNKKTDDFLDRLCDQTDGVVIACGSWLRG